MAEMKQMNGLAVSTALLAALSACGGTNAPPPITGPGTTRIFAEDAGNAGQALADGATLEAQAGGNASFEIDWNNGTTTLKSGTFKVRKNASGELTMTVNGVDYAFAPGDRFVDPSDGLVYEYQVDGSTTGVWLGLWNARVTLDEALDPATSAYTHIWGYYVDASQNGIASQGYAAVGTETKPSDLAALPTATYSGRARMDIRPDSGYVNDATSRTRVRSDLSMTADFGAATIGGSLSNIMVEPPGQPDAAVAGTISMDQTAIVGNGFAGTLTPDATFIGAMGPGFSGSGNYGGTFFGPAADEVGGTMTMTGTDASGNWNGTGYFIGTKN
jgi:hypothetical protein